jgi:uncharacterized membrane protein YedE/YeeE
MNSLIAKAHRMQRKFIGVIVASGSVLAFILSFILIVAGIEVTALMKPPTSNNVGYWIYAIVWMFAGSLIAVLIERLTLTNCAKLRIVREKVELINEDYAHIENPTNDTDLERQKDIEKAQKGQLSIILLIAMGTGLSMMCESFIIHFLFGNFQVILGWIAAFFLSGLVSYTLISSELHKGLDADVIHESLNADTFLGIAARANVTDHTNQHILAKSTTKVREIANSDVMLSAIDQAVIADVDDAMEGNGRIILRIDNEREQKRLQMAREKDLTRQQLSLIKGGDGDTEPLTAITSEQRPKSQNYQRIEDLYSRCGEAYFTSNRKKKLAQEYRIDPRTIDRYLEQIRESTSA